MKNSKIVLFLAAFAFVVGITGCEVESEKHEHTFSKEWTSDAIAHWHAATCEHKTEISGIAAHTFAEWKITKQATETHEGERQRTCSVCKYVEKKTIAKLEHTHTFGDWIVITYATKTEEGEKQRTCSSCGYVEKSTIAKLECTQHLFGNWKVIKEATESEEGIKERSCSMCGYSEEAPVAAHTHIYYEWDVVDGWYVTKEPTETEEGEIERVCLVCGYLEKKAHMHDFSSEWSFDKEKYRHFHGCSGCSERRDEGYHEMDITKDTRPNCTEEGVNEHTCSICGFVDAVFTPAKGHSFYSSWDYDETNHWHRCSRCIEKTDIGNHQWVESEIIEPKCTEDGKKIYKCSVCAKTKEEILPQLGHIKKWYKDDQYSHVLKCERCDMRLSSKWHEWDSGKITKEETCTEAGQKTYTCSICSGTKDEIVPAAHAFTPWSVIKATETSEGNTQRSCSRCSYYESDTIPKILAALVKVKGATFSENQRWNPESEVLAGRNIEIKTLYVSDHEVTRGEYKKITGKNPSMLKAYDEKTNKLSGDDVFDNPVDNVSWYATIVYCNKLSEKEGLEPCYTIDGSTAPDEWGKIPTGCDAKWDMVECNFKKNGYRLPTEVEWEYLARGGNRLGEYKYSGSNTLKDVAWSWDDAIYGAGSASRKVKTKQENDLKLYDMSGNVPEWCWDWYGDITKETPLEGNVSSEKSARIYRGGGIQSGVDGKSSYYEVSFRDHYTRPYFGDGDKAEYIGFRVVRTVTE